MRNSLAAEANLEPSLELGSWETSSSVFSGFKKRPSPEAPLLPSGRVPSAWAPGAALGAPTSCVGLVLHSLGRPFPTDVAILVEHQVLLCRLLI